MPIRTTEGAQREQPAKWTDKYGAEYRLCPVVGCLQIQIKEAGRPDKWADVKMTPAHALTHLIPADDHHGEPVAYRYMDCNTGTFGPTKDGGIYYAEIPEYGREWEVTTKAHGDVLIERKKHAIANGYVDSHPSLTVIIEPLYTLPTVPKYSSS